MKLYRKTKNYVKGSISEMKKVVWPTKKQTINYSMIVIAMSLGTAIFFGFLDYFFNMGLEAIISDGNQPAISAPADPTSLPTSGVGDVDIPGVGADTEPVSFPTKSAE
jgi:preprotein translocase subunit SecE